MLIFRYLMREVFAILIAISGIMLMITTVSQLSTFLARVAQGTLALHFIGKLLLINLPILLGLLLPFAFYLALLLGYGRLYADSEMTVLFASGFSKTRLMTYSLFLGAIITALAWYLIVWIGPHLVKERGELSTNSSQVLIQTIVPGQFHVSDDGSKILYVGSVSRDHSQLQDVFVGESIAQPSGQPRWDVSFITAAHQVVNPENQYRYLQTDQGYIYSGVPGTLEYKIAEYGSYQLLLQQSGPVQDYTRLDGTSSWTLWQQRADVMKRAEVEWRVSLAIQVIILTLLAVPLSQVNPRQGRYAKFLPAIMFYVLYAILLFVARFLLENGRIPPVIGLWWPHVLMLTIIFFLYAPLKLRRRPS